jgi:Uma2 family endonuclease
MPRDSLVSMSKPPKATYQDLLLLGEDIKAEIIDGEIVEKAAPTIKHANAQLGIGALVRNAYQGKSGGSNIGGWWIVADCDVELATHQVYAPDIVGWRRENMPELPDSRPIRIRPDWVCEVLSKSNAANDLVKKFRGYHAARVPHYWVVDPRNESLVVYRYTPDGYLTALTAVTGETVRAEPFDAIEIRVGELFGHEET